MKSLAILLVLFSFACEEDEAATPKTKAAKAECHDLLKHIVSVSPQTQGQDPDAVVKALPIEDIQGCVASEPEIRACMLTASDVAGVRKCIPSNAVLTCMQSASKMKDAVHEKAKKKDPDPLIDKPFDDIRAKAWTDRDAKACDALKKLETTT